MTTTTTDAPPAHDAGLERLVRTPLPASAPPPRPPAPRPVDRPTPYGLD